MWLAAKGVAQGTDERHDPGIADPVVHLVRIFTRDQNVFIAQDRQVLRNITLRGADLIHNVLHTELAGAAKQAQNLETKRMGHGLQRARGEMNIFFVRNQEMPQMFRGRAHVRLVHRLLRIGRSDGRGAIIKYLPRQTRILNTTALADTGISVLQPLLPDAIYAHPDTRAWSHKPYSAGLKAASQRNLWLRGLIVILTLITPAQAKTGSRETAADKLEQLRARIQTLEHVLNDTRGRRGAAREQLRVQEQEINVTVVRLRQLDDAIKRARRRSEALHIQTITHRKHLARSREQLDVEIRAAYRIGHAEYIKLMLNQEQPAAVARMATYYRYWSTARLDRIATLRTALAQLETLTAEVTASQQELEALRRDQARHHKTLDTARARRVELLASLDRRLIDQRTRIEQLREDQLRLERLLKELSEVTPDVPRALPGKGDRFARLRGRLPLPINGRVAARFGESKDMGDLAWRGILLAAPEGRPIRAVARGRAIYSGWLHGFGMLLILDHGDGYMTLYGNNQAVFPQVGDRVEAGQPVGTVGDTGDTPQSGVYFEIRHNGKPHDPLLWCRVAGARDHK